MKRLVSTIYKWSRRLKLGGASQGMPQPVPLRTGRGVPRRVRDGDWRLRAAWGMSLGLTLGGLLIGLLARHPVGANLEREVMDTWFALRGGETASDVAILSVDKATQEGWKGRDFDAHDLSQLLRALKRVDVRGVLLTFPSLPEEHISRAGARELTSALLDSGRTWIGIDAEAETRARSRNHLPIDFSRSAQPLPVNLIALLDASRGGGHLSVQQDNGGLARAIPLQVTGRQRTWMALSIAAGGRGVNAIAPENAGEWMPFGSMGQPALLLNFPQDAPDPSRPYTISPFDHLSVWAALAEPGKLRALRDRWVIIGPDAHVADGVGTPIGARISNTEVQAVALDNLLTGRYFRPAPALWHWLLVLIPCAVVGGFTAARRPGWSGAVALLCACGVGFLSFAAWSTYIWLEPVAAWVGIVLTFGAGSAARARWRERHATRITSVVDALTQGSELIAAQKESETLLPRVLAWAETALHARGASVLLLEPDGETLRFACVTGPKSGQLMNLTLRIGQGIAGWVAQEGMPAVVNEAALDWRFDQDVDRRIGFHTRSILCVPLRLRDRMLGVIEVVNRRDGQPFDAMDAELLTAVANQAALVIENARLYERLNQRVEASESELARTNGRLQAEKTLLQTVLQSMSDGVVVTDKRGRVQLMNQAASALLPELGPQVLGRSMCDALPELRGAEVPPCSLSDEAKLKAGAPEDESAASESRSGSEHSRRGSRGRDAVLLLRGDVDAPRIIEAHSAPLLARSGTGPLGADPNEPAGLGMGPAGTGGGTAGSIVVFSDVTEQRNVERAKSDFVSFVAHEMRSPLTSISGFSSMLLRLEDSAREANPSRTRFLSIIRDESERLTRLINNLLDVARIEAGRGIELSREAWDTTPVLEAAADSQRSYSSRHRIICQIEPNLPPVHGDRDKVQQVLINLLSNALKYSPGGMVMLCAGREWSQDGSEWVKFSVSDQGPGIAPEERARLFGRFERFGRGISPGAGPVGGTGSRAKPTGTGLGLFLSKYLVEAHGGRIWVEGERGQGATFCFTLPTADVLLLNNTVVTLPANTETGPRALPGI